MGAWQVFVQKGGMDFVGTYGYDLGVAGFRKGFIALQEQDFRYSRFEAYEP